MKARTATLKRALVFCVLACALAGCETPGPRPTPPAMIDSATVAGAAATARVPDMNAQWWRDFGDAQLDDLVAQAQTASATIKQAEARLRAADALSESAGHPWQPQLNATGGLTAAHAALGGNYPSTFAVNDILDANAGLKLSWDVDLWGRKRSIEAAALLRSRAAELEAADARLTVSTALVKAYLDFDRAFRVLDTAQASRASRAAVLELTLERRRSGLDTDLEVETARAGVASAEGDIAGARESIGLLRHQIAALMGEGPARGDALTRPVLRPAPALAALDALPAELVARRPDVAANAMRVEAAAKDVAVARTAFYPNINLAAAVRLDRVDLSPVFDGTSVLGSIAPAITLPIYGQPQLRGNLHGADAAYAQAVATYNASVIGAFQQVADQLESLRELDSQEQAAHAALTSLARAFDLAMLRYRGGLADYLSVLVAQDRLLTQQRLVVDVESRRADLTVNLIRALGGGYAG